MPPTPMLTLRSVRVHNLKSIDVRIPLGKLTVVTGVSGAGKSSLVFDTLYAEAQRRYLQSFSVYTRQFLERFDKPDAEEIGDLPPAVAIRGSAPAGARLTVGSATEVDALLRTAFARHGALVCPGCGEQVKAQRLPQALAVIEAMPVGTRGTIAFPLVGADSTNGLTSLREEGFLRIQIGSTIHRLDQAPLPTIAPDSKGWVLLDRIEIGKTSTERITESLETAYRRGNGRAGFVQDSSELVFDERPYCARCERIFITPEPRLFDPDDPLGACPTCHNPGKAKVDAPCPTCHGARLGEDALAVRLADRNVTEWRKLPIRELRALVALLEAGLLVDQLRTRLEALDALDLGYLTLGQPAASLGDGPWRRTNLAAAVASNLVNVLYLIDEPTVGLHPRDLDKLSAALTALRDRGNTVVVVENDRQILAAADLVIDLGPGAGEEGGELTYRGAPDGLASAPEFPTSDFWTERSFVEIPEKRRTPTGWLKLHRQDEIAFPLGVFCAVTGLSGAGKRTLVEHTLYADLCLTKKKTSGISPHPRPLSQGERGEVNGAHQIHDVALFDQAPFARGARSNPATQLKIFDEIRNLFAAAVDAKIRNHGPGHFSFNQAGGRCETCEGQGFLTIDMQFLADVRTTCPECAGRRYRKEILAVKVRSLSIAEVLDLTVREAFRFFRAQPAIEKKLKVLLDVGLEHLRLGQSLETLSGSECQRLRLAAHQASSRKTGCLFVMIEPSGGLHPADVVELLDCFERLLVAGHSLIVIENDLDMIASADWVIDLDEGRVCARGTPEEVAQASGSATGRVLADRLKSEQG